MPGEESKSRHVGNLSPYTPGFHFQHNYVSKWCSSEVGENMLWQQLLSAKDEFPAQGAPPQKNAVGVPLGGLVLVLGA